MRAPNTAPESQSGRVGGVDGIAVIVAIRPRRRIVEQLRAVGLHVELKRIGHFVVPVVSTGAGGVAP